MKENELLSLGFKETPKKHFYYHQQGDMIIVAEKMPRSFALLASVPVTTAITTYLDRLVIHNQLVTHTYHQDGELAIIMKDKIDASQFKDILDSLYHALEGSHCLCRHCHQEKKVQIVYVDHQIELLCDECRELLSHQVPGQPVRFGLGLLGSFVLSLFPAIIYGFFSRVGMIIVVTGLLFGLTGYLGFRTFAGGMNRKGFWLSLLVTYLAVWIGEFIELIFSIQSAYAASVEQSVSLFESFKVLPAFLADSDVLAMILAYHFYVLIFIIIVYIIAHIIYKKRHSKPLMTVDE